MPKFDAVKDADLKALFEKAHEELQSGDSTAAVHTLSETYLTLIEKQPELISAETPGVGTPVRTVTLWPQLGANLVADSLDSGKPQIDFKRDEFSMSEAFTYYEFTVDTTLKFQD
jgi:hypothetical protein